MKGFIHILEIIIVALSIFLVVSLFADIPRIESDWMRTKLIIYGNDILYSLDSMGVNWLDEAEVNDTISGMLPANLEFDLMVRNAIKPKISIGCVCPQDMVPVFEEFLNDFEFNGVNTTFFIEWINYSETTGHSQLSFPIVYDLVLFYERHVPDNKRSEMEYYLRLDKGVMEISDMSDVPQGNKLYKDIFNLEHVEEGKPLTGDAIFQETGPGKDNYRIERYFNHIPFRIVTAKDSQPHGVTSCTGEYISGLLSLRGNEYKLWVIDNSSTTCDLALYIDKNNNDQLDEDGEGPYSAGDAFGLGGYNFRLKGVEWGYVNIIFQESPEYMFRFLDLGETLYPADNASEKIVLTRTETFYSDGRSVPVSAINYNIVDGRGRAVWLSDLSSSGLESDTRQLIKSLVVWAAGEEYQVVKGLQRTSPVTLYFYKNLEEDMFQPIEIVLTLGYK